MAEDAKHTHGTLYGFYGVPETVEACEKTTRATQEARQYRELAGFSRRVRGEIVDEARERLALRREGLKGFVGGVAPGSKRAGSHGS